LKPVGASKKAERNGALASRSKWVLLFGLTALISLNSCASPRDHQVQVRDGKTYGATQGAFRERWWQFYHRGLSFAEGHFWREAEADLRSALQLRDEDQRRKKTYGMHFTDYFPHRELGIVYYHQGRYEEALSELERSLGSEKSAKAEFYLDCARKVLIQQQQKDFTPPRLELEEPTAGLVTNASNTRVSGVARDDTYVRSVAVNGVPVRLDVASREVPFQVEVPLNDGNNLIRIEARDLGDRETVVERTVYCDRQGPVVSIDAPLPGAASLGDPLRLKGYVFDSSGLQEVLVNGRSLLKAQGREILLDHPLTELSAGGVLVIEARDVAGNQTRAEFSLSGHSAPPPDPRVRLAALDLRELVLFEGSGASPDRSPPQIELRNWTDEQTVFLDQVYLEGTVTDDRGVTELSVNGQSLLRKSGKQVAFSYLARLEEGFNAVTVEAVDQAGNRAERKLVLHRQLPKVRRLGSRLRITLLPLEVSGVAEMPPVSVEESLLKSLLERKRFDVVERRRLEEVLDELRLGSSEVMDPKAALRVGKLLAAQGLLLGSVVARDRTMEISLRLVDPETSLILTSVDVYGEDIDSLMLRNLCRGLVLKLCDELPLIEGTVVQVGSNRIVTDLGVDSRLKKGMRCIVFEEGEPMHHPVTGALLGSPADPIAHGVVQAVQDRTSELEPVEKTAAERIRPTHKVITQ
jgi:hypothetical protein